MKNRSKSLEVTTAAACDAATAAPLPWMAVWFNIQSSSSKKNMLIGSCSKIMQF